MKKTLIILSIILIAGLFMPVNAASSITEKNDIKISINGTISSYTDTPINVNGRTLLPLRELLTNLGVPNDDQHIIWNNKEQSVTVIKDQIQIYLVVGDKNAKVNDKAVVTDAAPVNYHSRVYIPARFVAEAFGMSVTWNPDIKTVSIHGVKEIKSADGKFTATIPGNWDDTDELNSDAELQAQSQVEDAFMVALMESRIDFTSFESWKDKALEQTTSSYENVKLSNPTNVTVNGQPAVQYVLTATFEGINLKMLLTYVNGTDYYGQILCWSLLSSYSVYENDLIQMAGSIKGL